ncbi:putative ATP-binding cassette sub-family A member 3, partial [Operophtera brumata]
FFGLDDFQTGNDNLKLLLTLRGLDQRDVDNEVKTWIDIVGDSGAPLTLLDEPTAGVDVAARRRVWSALRRALRAQRSVMEALCSRIGIMSGGVLRALGTPAELRARHAQGHAVKLKKTFPALIEDYSVTETTLEEVFLSFAKDYHSNRQSENTPNAVV